MSERTTREWVEWFESPEGGVIDFEQAKQIAAKLRKLAEIEDARPEQPEAMGEQPRPREGTVIEVDGVRYGVGPNAGGKSSYLYEVTSFGVGKVCEQSKNMIYWPHAIYKVLVEATQ